MTSRQFRIGGLFLSVAFAGLGIWSIADGAHVKGAFYIAISVAWLLLAFFRDRFVATLGRQRARIRS
jgi:hypothetical protein